MTKSIVASEMCKPVLKSQCCPFCGKVFLLLSQFIKHVRSHSEDTLICSHCGKIFNDEVRVLIYIYFIPQTFRCLCRCSPNSTNRSIPHSYVAMIPRNGKLIARKTAQSALNSMPWCEFRVRCASRVLGLGIRVEDPRCRRSGEDPKFRRAG